MSDRRFIEQIHDDIVRVVEHRLGRLPATRYGVVFGTPDPGTRTCAVLVGGSSDPSPGFVYGSTAPQSGDRVRVVIDPKGDRYIAEVLGRDLLPLVSALPPARVELRGRMAVLTGGAGAADTVWVCIKDATDTYVWAAVA